MQEVIGTHLLKWIVAGGDLRTDVMRRCFEEKYEEWSKTIDLGLGHVGERKPSVPWLCGCRSEMPGNPAKILIVITDRENELGRVHRQRCCRLSCKEHECFEVRVRPIKDLK